MSESDRASEGKCVGVWRERYGGVGKIGGDGACKKVWGRYGRMHGVSVGKCIGVWGR